MFELPPALAGGLRWKINIGFSRNSSRIWL